MFRHCTNKSRSIIDMLTYLMETGRLFLPRWNPAYLIQDPEKIKSNVESHIDRDKIDKKGSSVYAISTAA